MTQASSAPNPAEAYERYAVQNVSVPWTADLLRRAAPRDGERVLDLACGTGIVARKVAPLVGPQGVVTGLDISPNMLAVARSVANVEGVRMEWHEGSGTAMPFPDASFDLVLCQQGLQFFPDHQAGLKEIWRVLAPGGRAVVSAWCGLEQQQFMKAIDTVVAAHVGPNALALPFALSDPTHLEHLARAAGFEDVRVERVSMTIHIKEPQVFAPMLMQSGAAVLPQFAELSPEERQALIGRMKADLEEAVKPLIRGDELVSESVTNVLTVWR